MSNHIQNNNNFIQEYNHNIWYNIENYLSNKIFLIGVNNNYSLLSE